MTKFVESLVERSPGFTDVHQEIFTSRADAVKAGYLGISLKCSLVAVNGTHGVQGREHQVGVR